MLKDGDKECHQHHCSSGSGIDTHQYHQRQAADKREAYDVQRTEPEGTKGIKAFCTVMHLMKSSP